MKTTYEYALQSIKSKKFWSNNSNWTKNLDRAWRWKRKGDITPSADDRLIKVKVITQVIRA